MTSFLHIFLLCAEILEIFIKNNRDIKGIVIYGIEYKLSQYADDTSLVLDGSSKFTDGILRVWDYFGDLSGLKINYTKTCLDLVLTLSNPDSYFTKNF